MTDYPQVDVVSLPNPKRESRNLKPETRNPKPENRIPKPSSRNLKPETRNPRPETRNPRHETRNPKLKNLKPETRNTKPETRIAEQRLAEDGGVGRAAPGNPKPEPQGRGRGSNPLSLSYVCRARSVLHIPPKSTASNSWSLKSICWSRDWPKMAEWAGRHLDFTRKFKGEGTVC